MLGIIGLYSGTNATNTGGPGAGNINVSNNLANNAGNRQTLQTFQSNLTSSTGVNNASVNNQFNPNIRTFFDRITKDIEIVRVALLLTGIYSFTVSMSR